MIKEIKYRGISEQPSDYECQDGELASVVGMVPEDGGLRAVQEPYKKFTLPDGYTVAFIHQNTGYKHYIIKYTVPTGGTDAGTVKLYWIDGSKTAYTTADFTDTDTPAVYNNLLMTLASGRELYEVNSTGNTLVVLTSDGMYYILWKGELDEHGYKMLGNHLPELPISFGLQGEMVRDGAYITDVIDFPRSNVSGDIFTYYWSDENTTHVSDQVLARVNKFIADESTNKGRFMFPFLVRYAYRLTDQTLVMHSSPVLMMCSSGCAPLAIINAFQYDDSEVDKIFVTYAAMTHQLDYAIMDGNLLAELQEWSDIVESVDIFVTPPIYTYDQNGKCKGIIKDDYSDIYSVCKHTNQAAITDPDPDNPNRLYFPLRYQVLDFPRLYAKTFYPTDYETPNVGWNIYPRVMLPTHDVKTVQANIEEASRFYLLKSLRLQNLTYETETDYDNRTVPVRTVLDVPADYLATLTTRELMSDDYDSHDTLIPKKSFTYNSRLHISGLSKRLFTGYQGNSIFAYTNGYVAKRGNVSPTFEDSKVSIRVYYFIQQDGKEIVVEGDGALYGRNTPFLYLYYPNTHAYKAQFYLSLGYGFILYEVPLYKHATLNGVYYFDDWQGIVKLSNQIPANLPDVTSLSGRIVTLPNALYTSEVGNPFVFTSKGVNTIGTGQIIGIRPAAKAMSPSQYGDYVFYVLSSDGVWVLKPSSEGYLEKPTFVTPDVVLGNGESITQVDSVVLFASARGVMLLDGSKCTCISDSLNSEQPFKPFMIPAGEPQGTVVDVLPGLSRVVSEEDVTTLQVVRFRDYLDGCRMLYDYVHQRVLLYNPEQPYAYVYSMKSKQWGMLPSTIQETLPSYPHAEAMIRATREEQQGEPATTVTVDCNAVVDYSEDTAADGEQLNGLIITRPMKLDLADALKTVTSVIQRGMFRKGHVKTVLYASRDLVPDLEDGKSHWHLVWSSQDHYLRGFSGTPYKYFRLALLCELEKQESLDGCSVQYDIRLTDRLR